MGGGNLGKDNVWKSSFATISGGRNNTLGENSPFSTIKGGVNNTLTGKDNVLVGVNNTVIGERKSTVVINGVNNIIDTTRGLHVVAGGEKNSINNEVTDQDLSRQSPTVARPEANTISGGLNGRINAGTHNLINGGENNKIAKPVGTTDFAVIGGGENITVGSNFASSPGGSENVAEANNAVAIGKGAINAGKDSLFINTVGEKKKVKEDNAFTVNANKISFHVGSKRVKITKNNINNLKAILNPDSSPDPFIQL